MKLGFMYSSLVADVSDSEWKSKLSHLKEAGVDFVSAVMEITRPFCVYPTRMTGPYSYEFIPEFWNHLDNVVDYCNEIGMGLQLDLFNEPSRRHGNSLWMPFSDPAYVRERPKGAWANYVRTYVAKSVSYLNKLNFGAVLYVLEGTGSKDFEMFCHSVAATCSTPIKPSIKIISNSVRGMPGVIHSSHISNKNSFEYVKNHSGIGAYLSTDGCYHEDYSKAKKWSSYVKSKGGATYETWANGIPSGYFPLDAKGNRTSNKKLPYEKRFRPTLSQWRGEIADCVRGMVEGGK